MKELPKLPYGMGTYDYVNNRIRFRKHITAHGISKTLTVVGDSVPEVNKLMNNKEREFLRDSKTQSIRTQSKTLENGIDEWLRLYKVEEVTPRSYDRVECTFLNHIKGTNLGRTVESKITSDLIQKHLKESKNVITGEPLSYSSQKKIYELLSQYFKFKFSKNPYLNPMIVVTRPRNNDEELNEELIVWDDDEMITLTQIAFQPEFQHGLAIAFLMWSFMRIGELLALKWEDIDFENKTVDINKQLSKVRDRDAEHKFKLIVKSAKYKSSRKFIMSDMAYDCIVEYKKRKGKVNPNDYVLDNGKGKPASMSLMNVTYKNMIKSLPQNKHVTIHGLRHSGISYFLRHGVPVEVVSKMAGHKSIQITLDTYYSVLESQKNSAMEEFNKNNTLRFK